jgi:glycosyltransferase involved in cell wall biosynthesis
MVALRNLGHEADVFCSTDTDHGLPNIRLASVPSTLTTAGRTKPDGSKLRTFTDLVGWYNSLNEASKDYDYVILNNAFNSFGLFYPLAFMTKSVLINHFCHPGMIEGEGGLRLQLLGRWLQQMGGRCFSSGASNIEEMRKRWEKPHKRERMLLVYDTYIKRIGLDINRDLFEGWVDVNVIPHDRAEFALINQKKVVAIGRPVPEKNTLLAAQALANLADLGFECHIFTTDIGDDFDAIRQIKGIQHYVNTPHAHIMQHVADARCLLFPSKSETNGIVAFEAASHGVPVIYQCDEPDFFLQPSGLGHKYQASKNKKEVIASLVQMAQSIEQTDEERYEKRSYFDEAYSEQALVNKLLNILPTDTRKPVTTQFYQPVQGKIISHQSTKKGKVPQPNTVNWSWANHDKIPAADDAFRMIYAIKIDGEVRGVGETVDMHDRIPNGYAWKVRTNRHDGSTVIAFMQELAKQQGGNLIFEAEFLERAPKGEHRQVESKWIEHFRAEGHRVMNRTLPTKPKKEPKPKTEKPPKVDSKGGGWQVKAEWVGKGLKVRCKAPVDGSFWECDHDQLVNAINASLKAKGKPLIGEPGPSEKAYGASSGLREQHLWTRV